MQKIFGWSEKGSTLVSVQGLSSVTKVQGSFPLSTVTVYVAGTVTLASIFSDNAASPTPLANPFTVSSTGAFSFFAVNGAYDIVFSGTGIAVPFTLSGISVFDEAALWVDITAGPFFADPTGVRDATTAARAAYAFGGSNCYVYWPPGTYLITGRITIVDDRVYTVGAGEYATMIVFAPTANETCFYIKAATAADVFQGGISDLTLYSNDNTWVKIGINIVHVSTFRCENLTVAGSISTGLGQGWCDASHSSVAFKSNGHEAFTSRNCLFVANKPIVIGLNPVSILSCDHFHFQDLSLIGDAFNYLITVENGVYISNTTFDGYQAWVGGIGGFYWTNVYAAASNSLRFDNVRYEQCQGTAGWWFYIDATLGSLQGLSFNNLYGVTTNQINGFYLRSITGCVWTQVWYIGNKVALNVDSSDSAFIFWDTYLGVVGATLVTTGFVDYLFHSIASAAASVKLGLGSGISIGGTAVTGEYLQLPNAKYLGFRNAADNATIKVIGLGTNNAAYLMPAGGTVNIGDGVASILRIGLSLVQSSSHVMVLPNEASYSGENAAGADSIPIARIDASNRLVISANPYAVRFDALTMGFFGVAPGAQGTSGANLTNNVTAGGSTDVIANYTDLVTYANDAAAIRNDIYQLSKKLKQINDGLRVLGLFT